jgi:MIP family channel proteins
MRNGPPPPLRRRLAAEVVGTFFLTLVSAGGVMVHAIDSQAVSPAARATAGGLMVMALIYTLGPISGAHMNPAITLAFALRRVFPVRHLALYWLAEMGGALLASWTLRAALGAFENLGAPSAAYGAWLGFGTEALLTLLLVSVVLGTATHHSIVGANAAIAVGGTIALAGLAFGPLSGASMNPARSLAPMIASGSFRDTWVFAFGPFAGAIAGAGLARALHGPHRDSERETAEGSHDG